MTTSPSGEWVKLLTLRQGLNEEFYPRFREIGENDKDTLKQLISNREKSLIIAGNAEAGGS